MFIWIAVYIVVSFAVALAAREVWIAVLLPAQARLALSRGDRKRLRALLEQIVSSHSFFGAHRFPGARINLASLYMDEGQYGAAALQCRELLRTKGSRGFEGIIRRQLADCLEGGGDAAGAAEQRRLADGCLTAARPGLLKAMLEARTLSEAGRHTESVVAYEESVQRLSSYRGPLRAQTMLNLALAAQRSGQTEKSVRWAEEALRGRLPPTTKQLAHSVASLGYVARGGLDPAEYHVNSALKSASECGNQEALSGYTLSLATLKRQRGDLVAAIEACRRAASMSVRRRRRALQLESGCLRIWGRYEDARTALVQARLAKGMATPRQERHSQAILALAQAGVEADDGRIEEARLFLAEARVELDRDEKISRWCLAHEVWLLASSGDRNGALEKISELAEIAAKSPEDRQTKLICAGLSCRALFECGEYGRCKERLQEYPALAPDPVQCPGAYYFLGECCLHLGDTVGARAAFIEAVVPGIDTLRARLARARLDEMDARDLPR